MMPQIPSYEKKVTVKLSSGNDLVLFHKGDVVLLSLKDSTSRCSYASELIRLAVRAGVVPNSYLYFLSMPEKQRTY